MVHSFGPHYGEERCLTGTRGSGTIFFTWCNLRCVFCQNYQIAQHFKAAQYPPLDRPLTVEEWQAAVATARHSGLPLVDGPVGDPGNLRRALE
jgi:uncharacterized Fe-S radical SAM superfamily protein PflX